MGEIENRINNILEAKELAKGIRKYIDKMEKSGDIDSLLKVGELIKEMAKEDRTFMEEGDNSIGKVISDLFRDKK